MLTLTIQADNLTHLMDELRSCVLPTEQAVERAVSLKDLSDQELLSEVRSRFYAMGMEVIVVEAKSRVEDPAQTELPLQTPPDSEAGKADAPAVAISDDAAKAMKAEALAILKEASKQGADGARWVARVRAEIGVTKFSEVPLSRAADLLALARKAQA